MDCGSSDNLILISEVVTIRVVLGLSRSFESVYKPLSHAFFQTYHSPYNTAQFANIWVLPGCLPVPRHLSLSPYSCLLGTVSCAVSATLYVCLSASPLSLAPGYPLGGLPKRWLMKDVCIRSRATRRFIYVNTPRQASLSRASIFTCICVYAPTHLSDRILPNEKDKGLRLNVRVR